MFVFVRRIGLNLDTVRSMRPHVDGHEEIGIIVTHINNSVTVILDVSIEEAEMILDQKFRRMSLMDRWPEDNPTTKDSR